MKNYTNEEKKILLAAIDHYIDAGERARNILTGEDKDEFTQKLWKIQELRTKFSKDLEKEYINKLSDHTEEEIFEGQKLPGEED
jgi:hypothetical protein